MPGKLLFRIWTTLAAVLMVTLAARVSYAQTATIVGKVVDDAGAPISNVRIIIVGTVLAAETPASGNACDATRPR